MIGLKVKDQIVENQHENYSMKTENKLLRLHKLLERFQIEEFSQNFDYGWKEITKLNSFNQALDWENRSFCKQVLRTQRKAC